MYTIVIANSLYQDTEDSLLVKEHLKKHSKEMNLNGTISFDEISDVIDNRENYKVGVGIPINVEKEDEARSVISCIENFLPRDYWVLFCYDRKRLNAIDLRRETLF